MRTARHVYNEYTKDERGVEAALARYSDLVRQQEPDKIVSMFDSSAEVSVDSDKPAVGRDEIHAYFKVLAKSKVVEFELKATSTTVTKDDASQRGTYLQTTNDAAGEGRTLKGTFEATWTRKPGGDWLLHRMRTSLVERDGERDMRGKTQ